MKLGNVAAADSRYDRKQCDALQKRQQTMKPLLVTILVMQASVCMAADYQSCLKDAQSVDPKMRDCQNAEIGRQNEALNNVYGSLLAKLKAKPDAANAVRNAERSWVRFRDADCSVIDAVYGDGSMDRLKHGDCIIDMTKSRVSTLTMLDQTPDLGEQ